MSLSPSAANLLNRPEHDAKYCTPPPRHIPLRAYDAESEAALMEGVISCDGRAEAEFIRRYRPFVQALLRRSGLDAGEQEDAVQDVFGRLWEDDRRRLRQWRGAGNGRFISFLGAVTRRIIYDCYRKKRELPLSLPSHPEGSAATSLPLCEDDLISNTDLCSHCHLRQQASAIWGVLRSVAPRDAGLLMRRYLYGQSYREIAAALGMTVNHVGVALTRAEKRVRARLRATDPALFADEIGLL